MVILAIDHKGEKLEVVQLQFSNTLSTLQDMPTWSGFMAFAYSAGLLGGWAALDDAPPLPPRRELVLVAGCGCADGAAGAGALCCCGTLAVSSLALRMTELRKNALAVPSNWIPARQHADTARTQPAPNQPWLARFRGHGDRQKDW